MVVLVNLDTPGMMVFLRKGTLVGMRSRTFMGFIQKRSHVHNWQWSELLLIMLGAYHLHAALPQLK